jgi:hypothetical protein
MSDVIYHDIDHVPDTVEVSSGDIIKSGPIERGVAIQSIDEVEDEMLQRSELYRGMAFEADRQCKLERDKLEALRHLIQAADNELANFQRIAGRTLPGSIAQLAGERCIFNARAALTKAKESA